MLPGDDRPFLVDLSQVQGQPDLARARDEGGVDGIIQKVTEGHAYTDPVAMRNMELADKLGLIVIPYGFCRPSQGDAEGEVERMWKALPVAPLAWAMDLENHPNDWSPAKVVAYGVAYLRAIRERTAAPRLTYSYVYFFAHDLADADEEFRDTGAWVAWPSWPKPGAPPHGAAPPLHKPWTTWKFWQYSADNSRGVPGTTVPGIPGVVDRNVYNGTIDDLRAYLGLPPKTTPADEPTRIVHPPVDFPVRTYGEPGPDGEADTLKVPYSTDPPVQIVHDEPDDEPPPQAA